MKTLVTIALLVMLPMSAGAANWFKFGATTRTAATGLNPGDWASTDLTDDSNSPMLNVASCENIDILFWPDIGAAGGTSTVRVYSCANTTVSTNSCWDIEDRLLDGSSANGTEAIYGAAAIQIYVDGITFGAGDEPRVIVKCNGPKN